MAYIIGIICFIAGGALVGYIVYSKAQIQIQLWKTKYETEQKSYENQKMTTQQLQSQMTMQFENLAQKIFHDKSGQLT